MPSDKSVPFLPEQEGIPYSKPWVRPNPHIVKLEDLIYVLRLLSVKGVVEMGEFWKMCEERKINPLRLEDKGFVTDPLIPFRDYGDFPSYKVSGLGRILLDKFDAGELKEE